MAILFFSGSIREVHAVLKQSAALPCDISSSVEGDSVILVVWYKDEMTPIYRWVSNPKSSGSRVSEQEAKVAGYISGYIHRARTLNDLQISSRDAFFFSDMFLSLVTEQRSWLERQQDVAGHVTGQDKQLWDPFSPGGTFRFSNRRTENVPWPSFRKLSRHAVVVLFAFCSSPPSQGCKKEDKIELQVVQIKNLVASTFQQFNRKNPNLIR